MSERRYKGRKGRVNILKRPGSDGGISFQFPPGWDDGSGKVKHIPSGPYKGRVYFTSREEARDIAKRHEDQSGLRTRYDPD
jgi:hypothetical protein